MPPAPIHSPPRQDQPRFRTASQHLAYRSLPLSCRSIFKSLPLAHFSRCWIDARFFARTAHAAGQGEGIFPGCWFSDSVFRVRFFCGRDFHSSDEENLCHRPHDSKISPKKIAELFFRDASETEKKIPARFFWFFGGASWRAGFAPVLRLACGASRQPWPPELWRLRGKSKNQPWPQFLAVFWRGF